MPIEIAEWIGDSWALAGGRPPPMTGFPDATNTGIAALDLEVGDLEPYEGFGSFDTVISFEETSFLAANLANEYTRIDAGGHFYANKCYFDRRIDCDGPSRSVTLENCTVDANQGFVGIGFGDINLSRCNVFNANNCVNIGANLLMEDCYIHDPYLPDNDDHINPFFHGGGGNIVIRHCTLWAPQVDNEFGGGVSTNLSMFPDFAPVYNVTIEDCFIRATGGAYGVSLGWNPGKDFNDHPLNGTNIVFRNNVFERGTSGVCGGIGPVTSWRHDGAGNVWENNRYEDGVPILPA
jgi:hypothetical protein